MGATKTSEIIRGQINSPSASLFETAAGGGYDPQQESRVSMGATQESEIIRGRTEPRSGSVRDSASGSEYYRRMARGGEMNEFNE